MERSATGPGVRRRSRSRGYLRVLGTAVRPRRNRQILTVCHSTCLYARERPLLSPTSPPPSSRPARSTPRPRFVSSSGTMQRAEFPVVPRSHFSAFSFSFFPSFSFLLSALLPPPARPHVRYYLSRATSPTAVRLRPPLRAFRARFRNVCPRARARHGNSRNAYGLFLVAAPCILINFFLSPFFPSSLERSAKYNAIENCTRQILFLFL